MAAGEQEGNCISAASNSEIIPLLLKHGGYGTIAMETLAEGRVAEPLESFIDLLKVCGQDAPCPFHVVGAIKLKLHFCLMVRPGMSLDCITKIAAHPKALGACKERIAATEISTVASQSNGEAARCVAENAEYAACAALGPKSAAEKYGLHILHDSFEDREAVTTFFLLAPKEHSVSIGAENRALIVFKVPHAPSALVKALEPFGVEGLNMIQIHSIHAGNCTYNFAIEIEVEKGKIELFEKALDAFKKNVGAHLCFGPFEVVGK